MAPSHSWGALWLKFSGFQAWWEFLGLQEKTLWEIGIAHLRWHTGRWETQGMAKPFQVKILELKMNTQSKRTWIPQWSVRKIPMSLIQVQLFRARFSHPLPFTGSHLRHFSLNCVNKNAVDLNIGSRAVKLWRIAICSSQTGFFQSQGVGILSMLG